MKSFKEYLTESKKTYEFKIKLAGKVPEGTSDKIKEALSMYDVESLSEGARTPIQESHFDFPAHKNVEVTTFDVVLNYPTNSVQICSAVVDKLKMAESCVIVRTPGEEAENILNHANKKSEGALLEKGYDKDNNQNLVGDKHVASFLKELSKTKTQGTQHKGTNEKLLAKKAPSEKSAKVKDSIEKTSPVGSKKVTKPEVRTAGGR